MSSTLGTRSTRPGSTQCTNHSLVPPSDRQLQRRAVLAVGKLGIGTGRKQRLHTILMTDATVTEHDGFDQGGPVQIVHVVQRGTGCY